MPPAPSVPQQPPTWFEAVTIPPDIPRQKALLPWPSQRQRVLQLPKPSFCGRHRPWMWLQGRPCASTLQDC